MNRAELIEGLKERLLQLNVEQIALRGLLQVYEADGAKPRTGIPLDLSPDMQDLLASKGPSAIEECANSVVTSAQKEFVDKIVENRRPKYDWDAVKEMYDTDATIREIAEKFNMPKSTIQTHAHRHGWKKRYKKWEPQQKPAPGKRGVKKGKAFWDCVRSDWEGSTDSVKQISRDMAVAESAIHYHAKKEGWGPRPKKATRQSDSLTPQRSSLTLMVQCPSCGNHTQGKSDYTCGHCHVLLPTSMRT